MKRFWLALLAAASLAACQPAEQTPSPVAHAAAIAPDLDLGRKVYNFRCYYCHGYSGDARTLASSFLFPKPRDFTSPETARLTREAIMQAISEGRDGTAMAAFSGVLTSREIAAVTDFIRHEFVQKKALNTRYHTPENGWDNHERYRPAYPFATGEITLDTPVEHLSPEHAAGRRLFMGACVSCHDRGRVLSDDVTWELRAVSYPPNIDACVGCHKYSAALRSWPAAPEPLPHPVSPDSPFELHDVAPRLTDLSAREQRGEKLFQQNCAFCHAADGTGHNWIGAFLEPHPRDLTGTRSMSRNELVAAIREGVAGTSMPAWKNVLNKEEIEAVVAYVARAFHSHDQGTRSAAD